MSRQWLPQRPQFVCVCGHPIEDHGAEPELPCLTCDECGCFCDNNTTPLFDIGDEKT